MMEFVPFPKIPRLNREIVITEKIDGTNAAVGVLEDGTVYAQSRSRIITPEQDNFGFARWVGQNSEVLANLLGPGLHFGEWWGLGIQRGYGQDRKRFSLFNTLRWDTARQEFSETGILDVVPVLWQGPFDEGAIHDAIAMLRDSGSMAAPGFMNPEGIVIFHTASRSPFKVTLEGDEKPKGSNE